MSFKRPSNPSLAYVTLLQQYLFSSPSRASPLRCIRAPPSRPTMRNLRIKTRRYEGSFRKKTLDRS